MKTRDRRPGYDWTVVLRRQPARMVEGRPEGGYTNMFEIICCDYGRVDLRACPALPGFLCRRASACQLRGFAESAVKGSKIAELRQARRTRALIVR